MGEFELIKRYFDRPIAPGHAAIHLGIGDDCALLAPRPGHELAISTDMLVAGRHFLVDVDAAALGWKALAVNLSDLAAMGAAPLAFTLALALPEANPGWLDGFSRGLFECAQPFDCCLIGGDTTRGPLNICITIFGELPAGQALRRSGARVGDDIWVTGQLGAAALGLALLRGEVDAAGLPDAGALRAALERPQARVKAGMALRGVASAMIDVSDGLLGDLGHLLAASGQLGAVIDVEALPIPAGLRMQADDLRTAYALAGGDDYELCFTAAPSLMPAVLSACAGALLPVCRIGQVEAPGAVRLTDARGARWPVSAAGLKGYDHFG